jgi:TolB-like protein/tetratricopeptide (TPR) repeat protein
MPLAVGTRLGPYEIIAPIGAGGMGEVYKACDTRLDRTVAIKILPTADPDLRQRFVREAKTIAALSHPHICVLHDVGEQHLGDRTVDFIVMEYLEGESLADRLKAGPLATDAVLDLARQVADALEAAHAADIVHRDLKPHNIVITKRGQAKVLDFGLAKMAAERQTADDEQPTRLAERALTNPGTTMGTIAYMSPEQARGDDTDARSDIFSFGAVLYEMATGRPAFAGRTAAVITDELLNRQPAAATSINPECPPALQHIIDRALEKSPDRRYQRVADLRADLERLTRMPDRGVSVASASRMRYGWPAAAIVMGLALVAGWRWIPRRTTSGPIDSIAVLPFVNAGGASDTEYLADGLAETLTNSLTRVRGLRVVPRTLAARYRNSNVDPHQAGTALNARAVVTGRVMQRGDRLLVQAELVDVDGVAQLWGDQYDRPLDDVLSIEAAISRAIADNLRLRLTGDDQRGLTAGAPKDAVAYQQFLKGRYETDKRTRAGFAAATDFFNQAIARDPSYARAYAGLAYVYLWQAYWGYLPSADAYPKATAAANRAVALEDGSADAHAALGWLNLYYHWDWAGAAREYDRALAIDPSAAYIHQWNGESLSTRGRHDDAIAELKEAIALDPLSTELMTSLGFVLINATRFDEAIAEHQAAVSKGAESTLAQLDLTRAYRLAGKIDLAIAEGRKMLDNGDPLAEPFMAMNYARAGRRAEALTILRKMEDNARSRHQGNFLVAAVHAALGETDPAFRWLDEAFKQHDTFLPWLKVDPELAALHDDPRFAEMIRRIGIPDR